MPDVRILIVDDEPKVARFVRDGLVDENFTVDIAATGEAALHQVRTTTYDLIVLDVMLPDMNGFEVCRRLRQEGATLPVLMLSARNLVGDRVRGLDTGADDYLTKPFDYTELSARIRALLRRQQTTSFVPMTVADLSLDPVTRTVSRAGRRIELTQKEFALLEYLLRNAGHVVTRPMIAEHVWDFTWDGLTNVIDVFINHVRRKIELPGETRLIHAVRGAGYVIREPQAAD